MSVEAFVDCETTGLDPDRHQSFEIALIVDDQEYVWWPGDVALARADPTALRLTRYYERRAVHDQEKEQRPAGESPFDPDHPVVVAGEVASLTSGRHLVGNVPSFDAAFLTRFLRTHGYAPAWHYHLIDVEALVAGALKIPPPWESRELSEKLGVPIPDDAEAHTALADARWAKAMYEAVLR